MINKESIINIRDFGVKTIEIPEWGGIFYIRKWSGKDRSIFWSKPVTKDGEFNWKNLFDNQALVVALSICDEEGKQLFTTSEEDLDLILSKNGDALQKIYEESLIYNGLAAKSIEESAKNSSPVLSENSISGLQENSNAQSANYLKE